MKKLLNLPTLIVVTFNIGLFCQDSNLNKALKLNQEQLKNPWQYDPEAAYANKVNCSDKFFAIAQQWSTHPYGGLDVFSNCGNLAEVGDFTLNFLGGSIN